MLRAGAQHALTPGWLQMFSDFWALDDLEGLTLDRAGNLYAITSHSRDADGDDKTSREKLVRFRIDGDNVEQSTVVGGLKRALTAAHPAPAAAAKVEDVKQDGGLNIEALEISPDAQRLFIGFRSPCRTARRSSPASRTYPPCSKTMRSPGFRTGSTCWIWTAAACAAWPGALPEGYLLIGGPTSSAEGPFSLWFWSGKPGAPARSVTVRGLEGFRKAEGICPAVIDGVERIVIVSDDGNRKQRKPAHFLLLDPGQLQIAP